MKKQYVWLNLNDGKFSNSWDEETHKKFITEDDLKAAKEKGWKLIEYTCLNDEEFSFYNMMQLK